MLSKNTLPFVKARNENPALNATTLKALQEAEKGNLKRFDTVSKLMKDLKK